MDSPQSTEQIGLKVSIARLTADSASIITSDSTSNITSDSTYPDKLELRVRWAPTLPKQAATK